MTDIPQPKALELADKLSKRVVPYIHQFALGWPVQSGYQPDDECVQGAAELLRQHAEIEALKTEVERIGNNRDMWKGQCERQSAELERRQEDIMRLDWLSNVALSMDAESDPDNFTVVFFGADPCKRAYGRTLRIAVDNARKAKK